MQEKTHALTTVTLIQTCFPAFLSQTFPVHNPALLGDRDARKSCAADHMKDWTGPGQMRLWVGTVLVWKNLQLLLPLGTDVVATNEEITVTPVLLGLLLMHFVHDLTGELKLSPKRYTNKH